MAKKNRRNNNYWEYRDKKEREWQEQQLRNDAEFNKMVQSHFDRSLVSISQDIDAEFNRLALRNKSTVEEARKAVSQADIKAYQVEAKKVVAEANRMRAARKHPTYNDWSSEVNERMRIYNATMRINRLEYLKSQIGLSMVQAGYQIDDDLQTKVAKDYTDELKRQASILSMTMKDSLWTSKEVQQQIMAQTNSATFSQRLWQNQDALKARLDAVLSTGIIEGSNPREMAAKLKDLVRTAVTNSRYVVERIARTESARVQHAAQIKSIKDNGYRYVKWYAEPGACKYCREIADNDEEDLGIGVFNVDDCPSIPVHPNCRCSISAHWVEGKNNWTPDAPESAKEKLRMNLQQFAQGNYNLSGKELWALNAYISSDAYKMNYALRTGTVSASQKETIQYLDNALEKVPIYKGEKPLQRDYFFDDQKSLDEFVAPLKIGGIFTDKAYISSSKLHYGKGEETIHVIIKSSKSGRDISEFNVAEQEVLFPRNTTFVISDAYVDEHGKMTMVWSELDE